MSVQRCTIELSQYVHFFNAEFIQLLMGISIKRYLPANGTAGLALIFVRG